MNGDLVNGEWSMVNGGLFGKDLPEISTIYQVIDYIVLSERLVTTGGSLTIHY